MNTATLTPMANQTPAVVSSTKELSGAVWVGRFPGSTSTTALTPEFRACVEPFIAAMRAGFSTVQIANTFRPDKRAYMMHWSHRIYRNGYDPASVPAFPGVEIEWVHPTLAQSRNGAYEMVQGFGIEHLGVNVPPALASLHSVRKAIDMKIFCNGDLTVRNRDGTVVTIDTNPKTGMNAQLKAVGLTYGVVKYVGGNQDKPHWSTNGH